MSKSNQRIVIGLAGSFGSGCSTVRQILTDTTKNKPSKTALDPSLEFKGFRLSDKVRDVARQKNKDFDFLPKKDKRQILQDVGDDLREKECPEYLAKITINKAKKDMSNNKNLVFDSIRNPVEIKELRKYFPNLILIAVDAGLDKRFERLKKEYDNDRKAFERDDRRDKDEKVSYGQNVLRCVEEADIFIVNNEQYETERKINYEIGKKLGRYIRLVKDEELDSPSDEETIMSLASNLALQSSCLKRRVGAILTDRDGRVIAGAYNEPAGDEEPCIKKYFKCYRDHLRDEYDKELINILKLTPTQIKKLPKMRKKMLDKCRSVHAEEAVTLMVEPSIVRGSTLYTTTFPCMQCSKRIAYMGIENIIYIDPYPEKEAYKLFKDEGIATKQFEGVTARAFHRFYRNQREILENQMGG